MKTFCLLAVLTVTLVLAVGGCASSDPGSRDYVPGKGWVPNN
jgi:hypothetical protein